MRQEQGREEIPDMFGDIMKSMREIIERRGRFSEEAKDFLEHALRDLCAYDWEQARLKKLFEQTTFQDFARAA